MRNVIFKYGTLSGIVSAALLLSTSLLLEKIGYANIDIIDLACVILSFLPILLGIRKYRDDINGGTLGFSNAVALSIAATLVANLFYVVAWLFVFYKMPQVMENFTAYSIQELKNSGKTPQEIDTVVKQMKQARDMYQNPWANAGISFSSRLPMALILSLIAGLILRRKPATPPTSLQ